LAFCAALPQPVVVHIRPLSAATGVVMNERIAPLINMAMLRRYKTLFTYFNRIWVFFVMQISIGEDINESGIVINNPLSLLQNPFIPVLSLSGCHVLFVHL